MKKLLIFSGILIFSGLASSCKKGYVQVLNFSDYVATDANCEITGANDTTQWTNNLLDRQTDTAFLQFSDNLAITDSITGPIAITPPCPDSSNGFFIWNVNPTRQCKLKLVFINTNADVLYYNAYALAGGPVTIGFDFRSYTAFKPNTNYHMYFGFYNANDSLYISGHGNIRIM